MICTIGGSLPATTSHITESHVVLHRFLWSAGVALSARFLSASASFADNLMLVAWAVNRGVLVGIHNVSQARKGV